MDAFDFSPATKAWFEAAFPAPTAAQTGGWDSIATGAHTLIHAPTGSGKTLAAFLSSIDRLLTTEGEGTRVLYISPLKALAHDVERNLRAPLRGIRTTAERLGLAELPDLDVAIRTGDTPQKERQRMLRHPPDILITTPESLYLMLTSRHRETFGTVETVIVDEVHAVAATKRGAHLALSLERLTELTDTEPQRIGLSATQRPLETIGRFLGGGAPTDDGWEPRAVTIVDATSGGPPDLELDVRVTVDDMTNPPGELDDTGQPQRSIWPSVYPELLEAIREERSTIVFANSRRLAERICSELNDLAGEEVARAHHGSVSRTQRLEIEDALKRGELPAVVATSTLELGIDMGAVDRVLQVESPASVASGLQRVGRAGHRVGETSRATVYPKHRGDLVVSTVVADRMREGLVEETRIPANPLDVLAQQLVAAIAVDDRHVDDLFDLVRQSAPFAGLSRGAFDATLDMLAGRYPSDLFAELRPRVTWDRLSGEVTARPGAHRLAVSNPGTIPDRGNFRVTLPDGGRVGELDEEMVYESRQGDVFVLGSTAWKITAITHERVEVVPAPGEPAARMPFWHGDAPGRPLPTGRAVGQFLRETANGDRDEIRAHLTDDLRLDPNAVTNLFAYLDEQLESTRVVPSDKTIVIERFLDEIGDWRIVIHSPLGAKVHAPWAMALTHRFREVYGHDVDVMWSDDGIAFRFVDADQVPGADDLLLDPDEVESVLTDHLPDTALFAARFREAAGRSLLLPKRKPGSRSPLWQQRRRSADLLAVAKRFPSFPIVLETFREILRDDFDVPALQGILTDLRARKISVVEVDTPMPSPFAQSLVFGFTAAFLYDGDAPIAERRANALTLDRRLLAELLGEGELRDLLDPDAIEAVELALQHLTDERKARHADAVADLLRDLGPLTAVAIAARCTDELGLEAALDALVGDRRLIPVTVGGEERFAVAEDASRLRDALGVQPPQGVADVFLEPVEDPLGDVVGRYARTHGPFTVVDAGDALGLAPAVVEQTLRRLGDRLVEGAFRRDRGTEWCDADVLRRIKRLTLAGLRAEIEPVTADRLAVFVPRWQQVSDEPANWPLDEVVASLQGAAVPASVLARDLLPLRTRQDRDALDRLLMTGSVVWAGRGAIGRSDGRVALYARAQLPALWTPTGADTPTGAAHGALRAHLAEHGASFFADLYAAAGGGDPLDVGDALWDLVWAGEVTNDSAGPLWSFLQKGRRRPSRRGLSPSFPDHTAGRWSLLSIPDQTEEQRAAAWVEQLLDRHGVITRSVVLGEGVPGGFAGLYPVLSHLESTGRIRRGYFVEGLGGAQFAAPGAVDRLRSTDDRRLLCLAATDPANAYGSTLSWPDGVDVRFSRSAGAYVLLDDGVLVGYWEAGGRSLHLLEELAPAAVAETLTPVAARRRRLELLTVNDSPVAGHPLGTALEAHGWRLTPRGLSRPT